MLALFYPVHDGLSLVAGKKLGHPHRAGIVGHIEADDPGPPLFQLPVVHGEDVALDHHRPHVQLQGPHGDGLLLDGMLAVDQLLFPPCGFGGMLLRPGQLELFQGLPPDRLGTGEGVVGRDNGGGRRRGRLLPL